MTNSITLADCEEKEFSNGDGARWTSPSGAWVEITRDEDPMHPLDDMEGIALAFREGDQYRGTGDDYPRDPVVTCGRCEGSGDDPDRMTITRHPIAEHGRFERQIVAAGSPDAMEALWHKMIEHEDSFYLELENIECPACDGSGEREVDLETYFRVDRGARAIYEFSTGNHNEASAVMYVTDDDWSDPKDAAKAWAEEYSEWAEGEVYGIVWGGPGVEEESCWGFIGWKHAKESAESEFLQYAIRDVDRENKERAHWEARDIQTVEAI